MEVASGKDEDEDDDEDEAKEDSKKEGNQGTRCVNQMVKEIGRHLLPNMVYNSQLQCPTSGKNGGENILLETLFQNAWAAQRRWWWKMRKFLKNLLFKKFITWLRITQI